MNRPNPSNERRRWREFYKAALTGAAVSLSLRPPGMTPEQATVECVRLASLLADAAIDAYNEKKFPEEED